ncbi:MAG: DUF1501 domain-containing protein [Pirellulales bacterium]
MGGWIPVGPGIDLCRDIPTQEFETEDLGMAKYSHDNEACPNASLMHTREGLNRRHFLYDFGSGIGSLALASLLRNDDRSHAAESQPSGALAPKATHFPAKAKSCIFLFMAGAPSQMDTFDPKPALNKLHGQPVTRVYGSLEKRMYVASPFRFKKHGESGIEVSELFPNLAKCVDDMAIIRSLQTSVEAHTTATFFMNTGMPIPGSPSLGAWLAYGLGSENRDLPGFVVLPDTRGGIFGGAMNWSNAYLPTACQGTLLNSAGPPIVDLKPTGISRRRQYDNIRLLNDLNEQSLDSNPRNRDLLGRMRQYELAFRMQSSVPDALDVSRESLKTREMYGLDVPISNEMGRKCLMARRMVERGVRFIQIYCRGWDSHENIAKNHRRCGEETDVPMAGLLRDLKQRGLLDETLVVWGGEFGRTADNSMNFFRTNPGRDHNKEAMIVWMAGGGVKGGTVVGATDDLGIKSVEKTYHMHDLHATILRQMGLDDMELNFYHAGRFKQLTDLGGKIIQEAVNS